MCVMTTEQEPGGDLSGFTRKAKPVALVSVQHDAHVQQDHAARARRRSIGQILAAVFSLADRGFFNLRPRARGFRGES